VFSGVVSWLCGFDERIDESWRNGGWVPVSVVLPVKGVLDRIEVRTFWYQNVHGCGSRRGRRIGGRIGQYMWAIFARAALYFCCFLNTDVFLSG
jgi:hypothetical protein